MDKNIDQREQNIEIAKRFINNMFQPHYKDSFDIMNDDFQQELPYAHDAPNASVPPIIKRENYEEMAELGLTWVSDISFTINKIHQMLDPNELIVEFEGDGTWISTGKKYCNRYISYFFFKNGKISLYREYFDPVIVTEAATP